MCAYIGLGAELSSKIGGETCKHHNGLNNPLGHSAIISPRTPPQGRAWGRGGGRGRVGGGAGGHREGAGASHATCRWPKNRSGGRDRLRLGWAETCNTLYKFRKINQTPDWPHCSFIKFFKKNINLHTCISLHYRNVQYCLKINNPSKNSLFRHFIVNNAKSSIDSLEFNWFKASRRPSNVILFESIQFNIIQI